MIGGKLYDFDYTAQSPNVWGSAAKNIKGNARDYISMMLRNRLQELLKQQGQSQESLGLASLYENQNNFNDFNKFSGLMSLLK